MTDPHAQLTPFSSPDAAVTPWPIALDSIRRSQKFWLTTVRSDGRPHVTPLLATWTNDGMVFTTGENEQKAHNLRGNAQCVLTTGVNTLVGLDLVIEGMARLIGDAAELDSAATAMENAYGWHLTGSDGTWRGMAAGIRSGSNQTFHVRPSKIFAIDNGEPFGQTRYRWAS